MPAKLMRARASLLVPILCAGWIALPENEPLTKFEVINVKPGLYVLHNEYVPGNVTALVTSEGIVLVDGKFEVDHENIIAALKKISDKPVRLIVNTHYHWDHSGGNSKMQSLQAQVIASEGTRDNMLAINRRGLPNIVYKERLDLLFGGQRIEVHHFGRAHTGGDSIVYFPGLKTMAAGDMFTFGDSTPQLIDYSAGGSAREWPSTMDKALQLDFDTVIPGHGSVTTKQEMAKFRDKTIALRDGVREMILQKSDRAAIAQMLRDKFHWTDIHLDRGLDGLMGELRQ